MLSSMKPLFLHFHQPLVPSHLLSRLLTLLASLTVGIYHHWPYTMHHPFIHSLSHHSHLHLTIPRTKKALLNPDPQFRQIYQSQLLQPRQLPLYHSPDNPLVPRNLRHGIKTISFHRLIIRPHHQILQQVLIILSHNFSHTPVFPLPIVLFLLTLQFTVSLSLMLKLSLNHIGKRP